MFTNSRKRWAFIPVAIAAGVAFFSFVVMMLWNHLMPQVFGLPEISFWQALFMLLLSRILFGGHFRHGHNNHFRMRRDVQTMSTEERETFREKWASARAGRRPMCGQREEKARSESEATDNK